MLWQVLSATDKHMSISFPNALKIFADGQVNARDYGTRSKYAQELIRKWQDRQYLHDLLLAVAKSAANEPVDDDYFETLRAKTRKVQELKAKPGIGASLLAMACGILPTG